MIVSIHDWPYVTHVQHITPVMNSHNHGGVINTLEQWSDNSEYGTHLYSHIPVDHLYHNLDPVHDHVGEGDMLEVMLPGGEIVATTLVRHATGKIIPLVQGAGQANVMDSDNKFIQQGEL